MQGQWTFSKIQIYNIEDVQKKGVSGGDIDKCHWSKYKYNYKFKYKYK